MEIIKVFIDDMIHMTEGEKFIKYWWLWPSILVIVMMTVYAWEYLNKRR